MKSGSVFPYPYYPDCFYPKHWITTLHYEEPKPDTDKTLSSLLRVRVCGLVVSLWWRFDLEFPFRGHGSWLCPGLSHFFNLPLPFMSLKMLGSYLRIVLGYFWFWFLTIRLNLWIWDTNVERCLLLCAVLGECQGSKSKCLYSGGN